MNRTAAGHETRLASRALGEGRYRTELSVPGVHNLLIWGASVTWHGTRPPDLLPALDALGFPGHLSKAVEDRADPEFGRLIRALAVAGFASMNFMLLSVSVWSGADAETRLAFHWISAALALPCFVYSGRIFFLSARGARTARDGPSGRSPAAARVRRGDGIRPMNSLVFLVPLALVLGGIALAAFFWSLRRGQYDDLPGAAEWIFHDPEADRADAGPAVLKGKDRSRVEPPQTARSWSTASRWPRSSTKR